MHGTTLMCRIMPLISDEKWRVLMSSMLLARNEHKKNKTIMHHFINICFSVEEISFDDL
jgi:hypothetical protein